VNKHEPRPSNPRQTRIHPASIADKPTVMGTPDLMDVLQVGEDEIQKLVSSGRLRPLAYSPQRIKVWQGEVVAFLKRETGASEPAKGGRQERTEGPD